MAREAWERLRKFQAEAMAFLAEKDTVIADRVKTSRTWRFAHFWLLVGKSFQENRCPVRASALAYTTLLALIPILAVAALITTSFLKKDGAKPLRQMVSYLISQAAPQLNLMPKGDVEEAAISEEIVVNRILGYIENTDNSTLGITAVAALIFVGISLLATIESAFNDIWRVSRGRGWISRIVHYWAVTSLGPLLVITAFGLSFGSRFKATHAWLERVPFLSDVLFNNVMPWTLITLAFAVLYSQMPNTAVRWQAALAGGVVGGTLWQLNSIFSALYLSRVVSYSKIYGSLGALPIFLIGLYFSWLIVLFGAQVAYAYQNREAYLQEREARSVNQRGREFAGLRIATEIARQFLQGKKTPTRLDLAARIGVSSYLVAEILSNLVENHLLIEVAGPEIGYAPARPLPNISAHDILHSIRAGFGQEPSTREDPSRALVRLEFDRILAAEKQAAGSVTLQDLAVQSELQASTVADQAVG